MKVVLLAGGLGTRISEESHLKPKPMIEIGEKPILWHIMKIYSHYGYNDFIICAGYKGHVIKEYFANYYLYNSDITYDFSDSNKIIIHNNAAEPWKVTIVDTGLETMTGGRIKRVKDFIGDETFLMTYGDGVADVNIADVVEYHKKHGKMATMTCVQPAGRFGSVEAGTNNIVKNFKEKPQGSGSWINAGFFVFEPEIIDYIAGDKTTFEREPLERAASEKRLTMYKHYGYWQCMDTLRDKNVLEELWSSSKAPWKVWP